MSYIPNRDTEFTSWFSQFKDAFATYALGLGFTAADVTNLNNSFTAWQNKYNDHQSAVTAARAARQAKLDQRDASTDLIRSLVKRIQANPSTTNQMRKEFGITVPKEGKTPVPPPKEAPFIELDYGTRGQVTVHVGTQPTNELFNKFPAGADFAQIFYRVDGGEWQFAAAASTSPFIHVLNNITPMMVEYRACYQNTTGQIGPWSESDTAYVSPIQNAGFQSVAEDEAA